MDKKKHIEKFQLDLLEKNKMGQCPFLVKWFKAKVEELAKLPDVHDRSGIAKGSRLPIPKSKYVLALHHITFKKLPLKEFCEVMGVNHGTGRNWRNTDMVFQEITLEFVEQYSNAFLRRYSELLESDSIQGHLKAMELIKECHYYPVVTVEQIKDRLENYGTQKEKENAPPSLLTRSTLVHSHRVFLSILRLSLKSKDADRHNLVKILMKDEIQDFDAFFKELREVYKSPEAQTAIDLAEMQAFRSVHYFTALLGKFYG